MIVFEIPGECKGKGRPRARATGKFVQMYTPKETVEYESLVKLACVEFMEKQGVEPFINGEELECNIVAYYSIPKSTSKKKALEMIKDEIRPTKKPDADNIAKTILDGLNKVAYTDDTQIVKLTVEKHYAEIPKAQVIIREYKKLD